MWDKKALHEQCFKHKIEFAEDPDKRVIFLCPKMPDEKVKISLVKMLPKDLNYQFVISPKLSTMEALKVLLQSINFSGTMDSANGLLRIESPIGIPDDHPFWEHVTEVLSRDSYFTGWNITLGDNSVTYDRRMAERIRKNIKRDHCPTEDEIKDLEITLGQDKDVNDIIEELFPNETD